MSNSRSSKRRLAMGLWCSGLVLSSCLVVSPAPALACSLVEPPREVTPSGDLNDGVPPVLKSAQLEVRRAKDPGSGGDGDCGDIGGYTFRVDGTDDVTRPEDLAYSFKLVRGTLPFKLPVKPVRATSGRRAGELSSWFSDDGEAFDAVVAVAMVDSAGNASEPVEVHASGDAVGCGCAMATGRPGAAVAGLALGALLLVRRSRRLSKSSALAKSVSSA